MNNQAVVDVFLAHPPVDRTEIRFLERLRRDLVARGTSALVLANLQAGRDYRQLDFVIVTEHRAVLCELKGYRHPVIGRANGPWEQVVNGQHLPLDGNPLRQAQDGVFALSDTMRDFARKSGVPGPRKDKFFKDIDTVACLFPGIPEGSEIPKYPYVSVLSYADLLERLRSPGPTPQWSTSDWEAFVRHLSLYREEEDSDEARSRRSSEAAVREYGGHFIEANGAKLSPLVETGVLIDGGPESRPELAAKLIAGEGILLVGGSGTGKTLWARHLAAELAGDGHVPVWLEARAFDSQFRTSLARSMAPYTTLSPSQLFAAAEACGRSVVVIVDGVNEAPESVRKAMAAGVQTLLRRVANVGVLVTAQASDQAPSGLSLAEIEMPLPDASARQAVLEAYGAAGLSEKAVAFSTPLELAMAAECASQLPAEATPTELLDLYVDRVAGGEGVREALRALAWRMHVDVRLSLGAPDAVRMLRRDSGLDRDQVAAAFDSRLTSVTQGRVTFVHERFAGFLAAEALLLEHADGGPLAASLNEPLMASLRTDAIALENDETRLGATLAGLRDSDLLTEGALGALGPKAEGLSRSLIVDALHVASARTSSVEIEFKPGANPGFDDGWSVPWSADSAEAAQLAAAGRCLRHGLFVDEIGRLLEHTDKLCERTLDEADHGELLSADRTFATTYAHGRPLDQATLPASTIISACFEAGYLFRSDGQASGAAASVARTLLGRNDPPGPGTLYVACSLLRGLEVSSAELVATVVAACLEHGAFHLRLEALQLAELSGRMLSEVRKQELLAIVSEHQAGDNLAISSSLVEALAALGGISSSHSLDDVIEEIRTVLTQPDEPLAWRRAAGIVSSQFEEAEIVGPYFEGISDLEDEDRQLLLAMALRGGGPDDIFVAWIAAELKDLDHPEVRSSVVDFVRQADPSQWHSSQMGVASVVSSLDLLAKADLGLPSDCVDGDPAWPAFLALATEALRQASGLPAEIEAAWRTLIAEHPQAVADLLWQVHSATSLMSDASARLERQLLETIPEDGVEALIWSLDHPDRLHSLVRWSRPEDRARNTMRVLGGAGDQRAAEAMRRFANDRGLGRTAVEAVRAIEARNLA